MINIPHYLTTKLIAIGITSVYEIKQLGAIILFQKLKANYPSLNYNTLYDLHCICNHLNINSIDIESKKKLIAEYKLLLPYHKPVSNELMHQYMNEAVSLANIALHKNEIPIGAVIIHNGGIISSGYNQTLIKNDILQHAEIIAIQKAQNILNNYRLNECDLYVTIEPCVMCSGAIINSRIRRVIYGANEPKTGAICSQYNVFANKIVNHHTQTIGPLDNDLYSRQIKDFFRL